MRKAMLYEGLRGGGVRCKLCAHRCSVPTRDRGFCRVRENRDGVLYSLVYGLVIAQAVDPIEKKPLFHFLPGSKSYSIATPGCNFRCSFCQNAEISQLPRFAQLETRETTTPERVVAAAQSQGCRSIAYTYTEPTVFFEFAYDTMQAAREAGLANVWVTNGYMTPECIDLLAPPDGSGRLLDAANVDLKAWDDAFYRHYARARLEPVLESMKLLKRRGVWLEVTTLVIPGLNDGEPGLRGMARFIRDELGAETPWHLSRFHPTFELIDRPPTPAATLQHAREIALSEGLKHIYVGNLPGQGDEDTVCAACGHALVRREGYRILSRSLVNGRCPNCGAPAAGVWDTGATGTSARPFQQRSPQ